MVLPDSGSKPMNTGRDVGKRIAMFRRDRKLSQQDLADAVSHSFFISRSAVNHIEHGQQRLFFLHAQVMAAVFHCSLDDLAAPLDAPIPKARVRRKFLGTTPPWRKFQDDDDDC